MLHAKRLASLVPVWISIHMCKPTNYRVMAHVSYHSACRCTLQQSAWGSGLWRRIPAIGSTVIFQGRVRLPKNSANKRSARERKSAKVHVVCLWVGELRLEQPRHNTKARSPCRQEDDGTHFRRHEEFHKSTATQLHWTISTSVDISFSRGTLLLPLQRVAVALS